MLNSINFMAAIMTHPMFNSSYPNAVNYARIGWVLGHELGHGFDNKGRRISCEKQRTSLIQASTGVHTVNL